MARQTLSSEILHSLLHQQPAAIRSFTSGSDTSLLQSLALLNRDMLSHLMTTENYRQGEIICQENEPGDAMYIIWSGRVAVIKGDPASPTVLGYRGPGEVIGEMSLLDDQPRSATNVALEDARLLRIGRENFRQWLTTNPDIGLQIMSTLSARLRTADNMHAAGVIQERKLVQEVRQLATEKQQLLELQRVRQETSDLIVHDLRNPLSVIRGVLSMFEVVLPEEALEANRQLINLGTGACLRMLRLVDSLLDVAKLESGDFRVSLAPVNVQSLLVEAAQRQSLSAQMGKVTLSVLTSEKTPEVLADVEVCDRILANLLDNALKYTPSGGTITLACELQDGHVVLSVTDSGTGIPPAERQRIFERFAQVEGARHGFGLGLTFCKLAVEAHGGTIWVEPGINGIGSRFAFSLPLRS